MKYVLALLGLLFCGNAYAQDAMVVTTCGTLPLAYTAGATRLLTVDTTGKMCTSGGGGGGSPGGSNTQVQYNSGGSFGGITGATTNGTALTLVAPVLGTPASGTLTNATGLPISTGVSGLGTGVATAAAVTLSAAGGLTTTIGSGTKAMATSAIASAACTSAQTVTVTGTATTDVVLIGFNGDPTAVTGFVPLTAGMLTIIAYPTADTVNIKECNNTTSSITPAAHTINVRVVR